MQGLLALRVADSWIEWVPTWDEFRQSPVLCGQNSRMVVGGRQEEDSPSDQSAVVKLRRAIRPSGLASGSLLGALE
jgi:hypothetical protein